MQRALIGGIFFCAAAMLGILLGIFLAPPFAGAAGLPHPTIAAMAIGGDGMARLAPIAPLAFAFHCLILLLCTLLAALGIAEKRRDSLLLLLLPLLFLWQLFICLQLWGGYLSFLQTGETAYVLGFPLPTAWQVYGVWLGAIPMVVFYCLAFSRYIYTEADEQAFAELLENSRQQQHKKA